MEEEEETHCQPTGALNWADDGSSWVKCDRFRRFGGFRSSLNSPDLRFFK